MKTALFQSYTSPRKCCFHSELSIGRTSQTLRKHWANQTSALLGDKWQVDRVVALIIRTGMQCGGIVERAIINRGAVLALVLGHADLYGGAAGAAVAVAVAGAAGGLILEDAADTDSRGVSGVMP